MNIKEFGLRLVARIENAKTKKWSKSPFRTQEKVLVKLIKSAKNTRFGIQHRFASIKSYSDFKKAVPVRDYEELKEYIELIKNGEKDILWPGLPIYFCKTSGTTSGTKYIPLTKQSLPNHINTARNALLNYISQTGKTRFINGKMIFIQGSPELENINGIPFGRLSGIVAYHVPKYLQKNRMPSFKTNCISDWEKKIDAIADETLKEDMTLISGIPAWVQMYFERLLEKSGKRNLKEVFPNFDLFVSGGVNFEPYEQRFEQIIGKKIDRIEVFPASEGFFAYQDKLDEKGMLLVLNDGIYYEFIKVEDFHNDKPERINLEKVELDVNYLLIVSTNAGLWGYNIGDTIKFVSKKPYRIVITGRIKHFISAFGEHVIAEEVESCIREIMIQSTAEINEFTVAPQVNPPENELPHHEWFIEFGKEPENINDFRIKLDNLLRKKNTYYDDLITGKILQPLVVTKISANGFKEFMRTRGKLGGQNKIPRLSNNRKIADELEVFKIRNK